jgi:hypothetical protein
MRGFPSQNLRSAPTHNSHSVLASLARLDHPQSLNRLARYERAFSTGPPVVGWSAVVDVCRVTIPANPYTQSGVSVHPGRVAA